MHDFLRQKNEKPLLLVLGQRFDLLVEFNGIHSERRRMFAFTRAVRMALACAGGQTANRGSLVSAVLARVLRFLVALVDGVLSPTWAIGMSLASTGSQAGDAGSLRSAIFAVIIGHGCCVVLSGLRAEAICFSNASFAEGVAATISSEPFLKQGSECPQRVSLLKSGFLDLPRSRDYARLHR